MKIQGLNEDRHRIVNNLDVFRHYYWKFEKSQYLRKRNSWIIRKIYLFFSLSAVIT
jgi:hypothetical protein